VSVPSNYKDFQFCALYATKGGECSPPSSSSSSSSFYSDSCGDNCFWTFDSNSGVLAISGTGEMTSFSSSDRVPWKNYTNSIETVTIGAGITSIGDYAFINCEKLTSVTIPDSVTSIGNYSFRDCRKLTSVSIPQSVTSIWYQAFYYCSALQSLTLPEQLTYIASYAFENCNALESVSIPETVSWIGAHAFDCAALTTVYLNNDLVLSSFSSAFDYNKVSVIVLGDRVSVNSTSLNSGYRLSYINVSDNNPNYQSIEGVLYDKTATSLIKCPALKRTVTIPNSVKSIGNFSFYSCKYLTSITIPNGVVSIGIYAFEDCETLGSINIPDAVTYIGDGAFIGCALLTSMTIPDKVTSILQGTFKDCRSLMSVTLPHSLSSIGDSAFSGCSSLESINMSTTVSSIGSSAFASCRSLTYVNLPDSVSKVQYSTFKDCISLISVRIPASVKYIASQAFSGCSTLTNVCYLGTSNPNSESSDIFEGCNELVNVTVTNNYILGTFCGKGVSKKDSCPSLIVEGTCGSSCSWTLDSATGFLHITGNGEITNPTWDKYNAGIKSVTIENGFTSIGGFRNCYSLKTLSIPDSVTHIQDSTFRDCIKLSSVILPSSLISIGETAFYNCSLLKSVTIPDSVSSIGTGAFACCARLSSVNIPKSLKYIKDETFFRCSSLSSLTIPESVVSLGHSAFCFCSFERLIIPGSVSSIGDYAFANCYLHAICYLGKKDPSKYEHVFAFGRVSKVYVPIDYVNSTFCRQGGVIKTDTCFETPASGSISSATSTPRPSGTPSGKDLDSADLGAKPLEWFMTGLLGLHMLLFAPF